MRKIPLDGHSRYYANTNVTVQLFSEKKKKKKKEQPWTHTEVFAYIIGLSFLIAYSFDLLPLSQ